MKNEDAEFDPVADLHERQRRIRQEMGGADRVAKMKKDGVPTIRDHIEGLLDQGTFRELGTHSRSMRLEDRSSTPGDGKVGGEGEVNGKSVAIAGDDITVKKGSSSIVGSRRLHRLYERAIERGMPYIYLSLIHI